MTTTMDPDDIMEISPSPRKRTKLIQSSEVDQDITHVRVESIDMEIAVPGPSNEPVYTPWKRIDRLREKESIELKKCWEYIAKMKTATLRQKNISADVKNGLIFLEGAIETLESLRVSIIDQENNIKNSTDESRSQTFQAPSYSEALSSSSGVNSYPAQGQNLSETGAWIIPKNKKNKKSHPYKDESEEKIKKRNTQKRIKTRPDALLIKPATGKSYSDVLREMRSQVVPDNVKVHSLRRTKNGDVLVQLGGQLEHTLEFKSNLTEALREAGNVRDLEHTEVIEFLDLDELTTEDEVRKAIQNALNEPQREMKITISKPNDRMQRLAVVTIGARAASLLVEKGRIRIGWVNARVRRKAVVLRCFHCAGYGHVSSQCKGPDRRTICYNCGETGHLQKDCTKESTCFVCTGSKLDGNAVKHKASTVACPIYKEALEEAKLKLRC